MHASESHSEPTEKSIAYLATYIEQDFALNRQMFLTEQGYEYRIERFNS